MTEIDGPRMLNKACALNEENAEVEESSSYSGKCLNIAKQYQEDKERHEEDR